MNDPMSPSHRAGTQDGFSLVELMVAAMVLVIGLLGALGMFTNALQTTAANNERVGATNLSRELVEAARSVDYDLLANATIAAAVQALPNLGSGSPWVVERRNVQYTVTASACVFDDPIDKLEAGRTDVCAGGPGGTTGDRNGDDFRRVTFQIDWRDRGGPRSMTQTALIVNPTGGLGPRILSFAPDVATITSGTTATFTVITTSAETVNWATDDGASTGTLPGPATTWSISWDLGTSGAPGSVVDGTYRVNAQAFDVRGIPGDSKVATVTINRTPPFAPANFEGGNNSRLDVVDMLWSPTTERDVLHYRVYDAGPDGTAKTGDDRLVACDGGSGTLPLTTLSCTDALAGGAAARYFLVAVDKDTSGALREGTPAILDIAAPGTPPQPPVDPLTVTGVDGFPELGWGASATSPLKMYRVYRGGTDLEHRIGVSGPLNLVYGDSSAAAADYYVTAVGSDFNESDPLGPVSWTPAP